MSDTLTAGPNGGFKKGKSVTLKNLDNKADIVCVDETVYSYITYMMNELKKKGADVSFTYRVATPTDLVTNGKFLDANTMVAWRRNVVTTIAHLSMIITSSESGDVPFLYASSIGNDEIYGTMDGRWRTSLD